MPKQIVQRTREEVIKLWVKALRSGKYKQTKKVLRNRQGFCCLGVLCDLAEKDGGQGWAKSESLDGMYYYGADSQTGTLSPRMAAFIVGSKNPYKQDEILEELVNLNDSGHSFDKIATVIEKKLL